MVLLSALALLVVAMMSEGLTQALCQLVAFLLVGELAYSRFKAQSRTASGQSQSKRDKR